MPLSGTNFDALTRDDLQRLIDDGVAEGRTIEYKRDTIGNSDAARKEFLKDVSALANAAGGYIILGMAASEGVAAELVGLPGINVDAEIQRLDNLIRDSLEPRVVGIALRPVTLAEGVSTIVIKVPKSWNPPHRVNFQKWNKFFTRNSNGSHEVSVEELRVLFTQSAALAERIRQFRIERIAKIYADDTPALVEPGGRCVVQIVPLTTFGNFESYDLEEAFRRAQDFRPINEYSYRAGFNFDGLLLRGGRAGIGRLNAYTQLFRDGVVETAWGDFLRVASGGLAMPWDVLDSEFFRFVSTSCTALANLGIGPPFAVMLSLLDVRGSVILIREGFDTPYPTERSDLVAPAILLDTAVFEGEWHHRLRPALDAIWNAYGYAHALNFDEEGRWRPRQ